MPDLPPLSATANPSLTDAPSAPGFGVDVDFRAGTTVVSVRGDVDRVTSPVLRDLLGVLVEQEDRRRFVLDLGDLTFMNAAGLGVVSDVAEELTARGNSLVVRAAPAGTKRMMAITGVSDAVQFDPGRPLHHQLAHALVHRSPDDVLDAALCLVTGLLSNTVDGAQGASITLRRDGTMTTVAATDETIARMDGHQYATGQGPCLSAAAEGVPVLVESLQDEQRWPAFVPRALEEGISSIISSPVQVSGRSIGALNVYADGSRPFGVHEQELAARFAAAASGLLGDAAKRDQATGHAAGRIHEALESRERIAHAQGVLMARDGMTALDAAARLHRSARAAGRPVAEEATAVLDSTRRTPGQDASDHG